MRRVVIAVTAGFVAVALSTVAGADTAVAPAVVTTTTPITTTTVPAVNYRARMETGVATTTTVAPLGFDPVCGEPLMRLALEIGWPAVELPMLDKVARRESGADCGNTDMNMSWNQADPMGGSRGTLQLNGYWCQRTRYNQHDAGWLGERGVLGSCDDLFTVTVNLRAGLLLWQRSGWGPWGF